MSQVRFVLFALVAIVAAARAVSVVDSRFSISAPDGSTFRSDYFFHEEANGWLKLHRVPTSWYNARLTCRLEGARLASPLNQGLYSTLRWLKQASRVRTTYTGVHSMSSTTDYLSIEGVHVTQMPIEWLENQPTNTDDAERCLVLSDAGRLADVDCATVHAFFCYKEKEGFTAMNPCGNSDSEYHYFNATGSCYKVHPERATWYQGHSVCTTEGGHLVVINSDFEAAVVNDLGTSLQNEEYVFVGLFNWFRDDGLDVAHWKTVTDQTIEEAGWLPGWLPGEPNNLDNDEYCGTVSFNTRNGIGYVDNNCNTQTSFICEIDEPRSPIWW